MTLFGDDRGDQVKMRSLGGPYSKMTAVLIKQGNLCIDAEQEKRMKGEGEDGRL